MNAVEEAYVAGARVAFQKLAWGPLDLSISDVPAASSFKKLLSGKYEAPVGLQKQLKRAIKRAIDVVKPAKFKGGYYGFKYKGRW